MIAEVRRIRSEEARASSLTALEALLEILVERFERDIRGEEGDQVAVVLGSTVSMASCLTAWTHFRDELAERIASTNSNWLIDDLLMRLESRIGPLAGGREGAAEHLKRASPEDLLEAAKQNRRFQKELHQLLWDHYGRCHHPQLAYELLAHMLRHRLVDDIVSFNWDELLDTAVRLELGPGGYTRILPASADDNPADEKPRIIKVHGTISSPDSLRFQTSDTALFTPHMGRILRTTLFRGDKKCHLVSLGFSWNDGDFTNWVRAHGDSVASVIVIRASSRVPEELEAVRESGVEVHVVAAGELLDPVDSESPRLPLVDHVLWALWTRVEARMREKALPYTSAARHILLGTLFAPTKNGVALPPEEMASQVKVYVPGRRLAGVWEHELDSRLRTEFFLYVLKQKGMVNLSNVARDERIKHALRLQRGGAGDTPNCLQTGAPSPRKANTAADAIERILESKSFTPSPSSAMRETYFFTGREGDGVQSGQTFDEWAAQLMEALYGDLPEPRSLVAFPQWSGSRFELVNRPLVDVLLECAESVLTGHDIEVASIPDDRNELLLSAKEHVTTLSRFRHVSRGLLEKDWRHLLVIAESGRWLFGTGGQLHSIPGESPPRNILLIRTSQLGLMDWTIGTNFDADIESGIETLRKSYRINALEIPWWRHNRHMCLALGTCESGGHLTPLGGTYFRRRLKTHRISPVWVPGTEGTQGAALSANLRSGVDLFLLFLKYSVRAIEWLLFDTIRRGAGSADAHANAAGFVEALEVAKDGLCAEQVSGRQIDAIEQQWFLLLEALGRLKPRGPEMTGG